MTLSTDESQAAATTGHGDPRPVSGPAAAAVAVAVGLLAGVVALSALVLAFRDPYDDPETFSGVIGTASALGLLVVAVAASRPARHAERRATLASWSGSVGALALGLMLLVGLPDGHVAAYAAGAVVLVVSVLGHRSVRRTPYVLSALAGVVVLYVAAFLDVFGRWLGLLDGYDSGTVYGVGVLALVLLVTAAGWCFPTSRDVVGLVAGTAGLLTLASLLVALLLAQSVGSFFFFFFHGPLPEQRTFIGFGITTRFNDDIFRVLACCIVLVVVWSVAAVRTRRPGFRALALGGSLLVVPFAAIGAGADSPVGWEVGGMGLAALLLIGLLVSTVARRQEVTR